MPRFLLSLLAVSLAAAQYRGQVRFGDLPVPGATVTVREGAQSRAAVTDPSGMYAFDGLLEGVWSFEVEKPGFATIKRVVTIAAAPAGAVFDLEMLPLEKMQSEAQAITPAAAPETPVLETSDELQQRAADGFLINGSAVNAASSPFAQARAFGNSRRGGPRLYTYALGLVGSDSLFDAANFSLTGQHTLKPPFHNLTGTASFGGPIHLPRLLPRFHPQFTANYSRVENRATSVYTGLLPDAAQRSGDFSTAIVDPTTGQPFAGGVIPASRISPQALSLLRFYPAPNFAGNNGYNYQAALIANTHTDNLRTMAQQSFKRFHTITVLLAFSNTRTDSDNPFQFLDLTRTLGVNTEVTYTRRYTVHFIGTFTYRFSRESSQLRPFFANRENVSGAAGIAGNNQEPLNWGPPTLQFHQSALAGLNDGVASAIHNQTGAASYASTWTHRDHTVTFGGDYRRQQFNTIAQANPRGTFTFTGAASGVDFADFLLGIPDAAAIAFGNADKYFRAVQPDLFVQDDWRLRAGLTILFGLRWEYTSPLTEKYGRLVNLQTAAGFTSATPVVARDPNDSLVRPDRREFGPRIGVAWRPFETSSLVLRAGYGISYNTQVYLPFANLMAQQAPLSVSLNVANTAANPLTLANGFYAAPNVISSTVGVDPNLRIGSAQTWNLLVQRDLPGSLQMVATYTGIKGTHQLQAFAPNTYPAGPSGASGYTYYTSGANSTRQAGSLQLRRRLHNGLLAQVQYTYSKSIDDAAALGGGAIGAAAQNWLDLAAERGPSTFDQRHLANLQLQYTSGFGIAGGTLLGGWRGRLFKDWTVLDAINAGTGLPLNPVFAQLIPGTGIPGIVRPDYTGAPIYNAPPGSFLNPAAFSPPASDRWGNAGRDSITGPAQFTMNASLARAFRLTERFTLNARVDAVNPLNHPVFTSWNTAITSPQFGLPATVTPMRTLTTTLRLTF